MLAAPRSSPSSATGALHWTHFRWTCCGCQRIIAEVEARMDLHTLQAPKQEESVERQRLVELLAG